MLVVFAGLPGTGKSTIARTLAHELRAVWLRIDSIEQGIRASSAIVGDLADAGYGAAHGVAQDNLRLGHIVVADSVNPWMLTRNAWRDAGRRVGAKVIEVEIICSDVKEHRHRVETRPSEVDGLELPDWQAVIERDYHPWDREHLTIDTAGRNATDCVAAIRAALHRVLAELDDGSPGVAAPHGP